MHRPSLSLNSYYTTQEEDSGSSFGSYHHNDYTTHGDDSDFMQTDDDSGVVLPSRDQAYLLPVPTSSNDNLDTVRIEALTVLSCYNNQPSGDVIAQIADTLQAACTAEILKLKKQFPEKSMPPEQKNKLDQLINEKKTWSLIAKLEEKLFVRQKIPAKLEEKLFSEKDIITNLESEDLEFLIMNGVKSWLEESAKIERDDEYFKFNSEFDPDTERNEALEHRARKEKLFEKIWSLFRQGDISKAKKICRDCNQHLTVASLSGGELLEQSQTKLLGNPYRLLWRESCRQLSNQQTCTKFERAIYGLLCGNTDALNPVCKDWDDFLWARTFVARISKIENKLKHDIYIPPKSAPVLRQHTEETISYSNFVENWYSIFADINMVYLPGVLSYQKLHEQFILFKLYPDRNSFENRLREYYTKQTQSSISLQLIADLMLIYFASSKYAEDAIRELLYFLIEHKFCEALQSIAFYASKLPKGAEEMFAKLLEKVISVSDEEKTHYLHVAGSFGIKVTETVKMLANNILIVGGEEEKMHAIRWLVCSRSSKLLVVEKTIDFVVQLLERNRDPSKLIEAAELKPFSREELVEHTLYSQFLFFVGYCKCNNHFKTWYDIHNARKPVPQPPNMKATPLAATIRFEHSKQEYDKQEEQRRAKEESAASLCAESFNYFFSLREAQEEKFFDDDGALASKAEIRKKIYTEALLNYIKFNKLTGRHEKTVQLATLLAASELCYIIAKEDLKTVLRKIAKATIAQMTQAEQQESLRRSKALK